MIINYIAITLCGICERWNLYDHFFFLNLKRSQILNNLIWNFLSLNNFNNFYFYYKRQWNKNLINLLFILLIYYLFLKLANVTRDWEYIPKIIKRKEKDSELS